jgi:protein O-mannosyl-transferase
MQKKTNIPEHKKETPSGWYQLNDIKAYLIIALVCFMCYGNTVFNGYSLDDDLNVTHNAYVQKGLAGIPGILTHPYASWAGKSGDYRPMAAITYAIENQFFGGNPHVSHFFSIIYFILCVCFLYKVLCEVFSLKQLHPVLPLAIAALFAAHPVHTEVVSSIKNREEILSLMFGMLSLLYTYRFLMSQNNFKLALLAFVMFVLAVISKVTVMPMIGVFFLLAFFHKSPKTKRLHYWIFSGATIVLAVCYFGLMWYFVKRQFYDLENPLVFTHDISIKLGTAMATLMFYLRMLFVPYPLSFYYGYNTIPLIYLGDPVSFFSIIFHVVMLVYGIRLFLKKNVAGIFLLAYFMCIFPFSNLVIIYTGIVSERAFFFASAWLLAAFVVIIFNRAGFSENKGKTGFTQKVVLAIGLLFFGTFSWLTIQRNFQWKDTLTLLSSDIGHLENSTLANFFYATLLQETGEAAGAQGGQDIDLAKQYYRKSLAVSPTYPQPYYKLGMIAEYDDHNNDSAFFYFKKAYRFDTTLSSLNFQLGKLYSIHADYKNANKLFERVYKEIPADTFNLFFYAQSLYFSGDSTRAYRINDSLMALAPADFHAYLNRGMFYKLGGNPAMAEVDLERVLQSGYRNQAVINALQDCYMFLGQTDKLETLRRNLGMPPAAPK